MRTSELQSLFAFVGSPLEWSTQNTAEARLQLEKDLEQIYLYIEDLLKDNDELQQNPDRWAMAIVKTNSGNKNKYELSVCNLLRLLREEASNAGLAEMAVIPFLWDRESLEVFYPSSREASKINVDQGGVDFWQRDFLTQLAGIYSDGTIQDASPSIMILFKYEGKLPQGISAIEMLRGSDKLKGVIGHRYNPDNFPKIMRGTLRFEHVNDLTNSLFHSCDDSAKLPNEIRAVLDAFERNKDRMLRMNPDKDVLLK